MLKDILTAIQNLVVQTGSINKQLASTFPQQTGTASSASAGAATLPAAPAGFLVVTLPNGTAVKVPYYGA